MHKSDPKFCSNIKNIKWFYRSIFICFVVFLRLSTQAQEYIYENYGVDDGLPSSEVYDTYQDKEGYIWFATDKGLSRYNGYEFENFNKADGLTGTVVLRFYPQKNGQIWCYSFHSKSIFYFDEIFNGFTQYKYNETLKNTLSKTSIVKSIYLDEEDNLHIGGYAINGELIIKNDGIVETQHTSENYLIDSINPKRIALKPLSGPNASVSYFTEMSSNPKDTTYTYRGLGTSRFLIRWLIDNEAAVFMTYDCVELISKNRENLVIKNKYSPIGLKIIDKDHFFIGYEFGGGKIVDRNGKVLKVFLSDQSVTGFLIDHEGGYWFTTLESGVFYIKNPAITVYNSAKSKSLHVNSLAKTKDKDLLIGFINGAISKLKNNKETIIFEQPEKTTHALVEYDSTLDRIYTYSFDQLKDYNSNKTLLHSYGINLSEPKDKTIFMACHSVYYEFNEDQNNKLHHTPHRVHDVCVWNNDTIIGTPLGLFMVRNNKNLSLADQSNLFGFRSDDIDVNDQKDIMYVATQGAGVVIHTGSSIINITVKEGLNSNIVNEVYIENNSTVWACTNRGLNRIIWSEDGMTITGMSKKNGLLSNDVEDIEIIGDTVWVGTKQGLCSFPKDQLNPKAINVPYLKLKEVFVNNVSRDASLTTNLANKENEIDFVLEGISFVNKDDVTYQFRLNKNHNWSSTKNRVVQFSSLSPGSYVFEAKMCVGGENCSEKTVLHEFTILAPFWKSGWFILLCLFVFGLLVYLFFKIKVLTYNKDVTRELIRLIIKKLKRNDMYFSFRENGSQVRIQTKDILYVKSAGNYIDVYTKNKTHTIRLNIGKFLDNVPDQLEYVRLHRSYIVRKDKITIKSKSEVQLSNGIKIPVSVNRHKSLREVVF